MTEEEIFDLYGVKFTNRIIESQNSKKTIKSAAAFNGSLFRFLNDWNNAQDINEILLSKIEALLNNALEEENADSETEWVEMTKNVTKMFYNGNPFDLDNPDFQLPTTHFKEIITAWRDFLEQPPLSGTKV